MSFKVKNAGPLASIQDLGRTNHANIGLTTSGAADPEAFYWANKLLGNGPNSSAIEVTFGGLALIATADCAIAITGAQAEIKLNNTLLPMWRSVNVKAGDSIDISYAKHGCRLYLAVVGGFQLPAEFGSQSTTIREGVGPFNGKALQKNDDLPSLNRTALQHFQLPVAAVPSYSNELTLRVITGYQFSDIPKLERLKFFNSQYQVSPQCDRMGYRLKGEAISTGISNLYSEGITKGAIQIPADGQPIVLANDRQTIGGYPKIGSVLSLDLAKLMQTSAGAKIRFSAITIEHAHNLLHLEKIKRQGVKLVKAGN
ncbi:biotin-dependent carboxyltransferase family protein [Paraferrimonas sp. SM1919]|uniref:5-oxoprolinase subunit C family protein n=1 Tax=Paraferrimonas sp. SM1919 TaxID=2662263 RepID=UPI0013D3FA6B|nr:biotin-dependent carboxyltransferase family protein [Paraferrimonas sp. SM1919]